MNQFEMTPSSAFETSTVRTAERVTSFLKAVYGWMFVGLATTAVVAVAVVASGYAPVLARNPLIFFGLVIGELGLVFGLSARVNRMSAGTASLLFLVYSALNGATLSLIFLRFTGASIATTFVITAGMFGALALFGATTKRSLAGVGHFVGMGLIGLILAMLVGFFWHSDGLQFVISIVGVIVFTGLTAWDSQRLKQMATALPDGQVGSYAVVGALSLYLDFINLFLFLLRFFGGGRRD
jgi:uncharacterized protein